MSTDAVTLSIDGKEVTVPKGTMIIRAAETLGVEIPRFCDHPLLDPVAACRQCYVSVEGQRKLMTSCSTPVGEGMAVHTQFTDKDVKAAQEAVLEFLLINHPLDCPICDRGGECPLQDQTLAFGPGESRYVEAKRTYRKPLALSPLVYLDRERCVLCQRCTRFCDEVSGDRFIELFDRGGAEQIGIAGGEDFRSPFSGNTVQICPVGALTASTYRFSARPFDVHRQDSVCTHCSAGCNLQVQLRRGQVVRMLARDNLDVNDAWLCDKGRFAFAYHDRADRLLTPLLRVGGLEPVSFAEAFAAIADWCRGARVGFVAGGRLSDEDAYALSRFARVVAGTNDVDHRPAATDGAARDAEARQARGTTVTYADVERATTIVVAGLDAEQEVPILHLRIRKAVRRNGTRVVVVGPRATRLNDVGEHIFCLPGQEAAALAELTESVQEAGEGLTVLAGARLAESAGAVRAASDLAAKAGGRFALVARRAGDTGALSAGVHPALLPFGRKVDDAGARAEIARAWGAEPPAASGRDTVGILRAAAARELDVLFVVGVDLLTDMPDAVLARKALENVRHKVVIDTVEAGVGPFADAMLPAAASIEKDARYSDWEGRAQHVTPVRDPLGMARPDWQIFQELSEVMGADMGFRTVQDIRDEMASLAVPSSAADVPGPGDDPEAPTAAQNAITSNPPEEGSLVLFSYRLLVDEGRQVEGADQLKEALGEEAFVEIHPDDASALGLAEGDRARVTTEAGAAELPVKVTDRVAPGAAFVPWNNRGLAANTLMSGGRITSATLTKVESPVPAEVGAP